MPPKPNNGNPLSELRLAALTSSLRACQLFAGLSTPDLEGVARIALLKTVAKGEFLFREGDPSHGFYIVRQGAINVHRVSPTGKEQVIHVFRPGDSFAEATLSMETGYPAGARAIESSQVVLIRKQEFLSLLRRRPELALRMIGALSIHLRVLVARLDDLTLKDVETRLANWLVKRCPDPSSHVPLTLQLPTAKRMLAAELGTIGETLSRTLAKLRQQQLIAVRGQRVTILSPARLAAFLESHLGE